MSSTQLTLDLIATFLLAAGLLFHYGDWYRHSLIVTLSVLVAWYFSFIIVLVLPIDISATTHLQCLSLNFTNDTAPCPVPSSFVGSPVLTSLWRVVYWTSQGLTWLLLPFLQSWINSGEFRTRNKFKAALLDNAIYYSLYLFICCVLLVYLATRPGMELDLDKLKAIASSASNSWGLFLLVFMLGYGLPTIPLTLYKASLPRNSLQKAYFSLSKLSQERNSAEENLDDTLDTFQLIRENTTDGRFAPFIGEIDGIIPAEFKDRLSRRRVTAPPTQEISEKSLVQLHKSLKKGLQTWHRCECQWSQLVSRVIFLEDVDRNTTNGGKRFKRSEGKGWLGERGDHLLYITLLPLLLKIAALTTGIFSLAIIWSESVFFVRKPVLSIFALLVGNAGNFQIEFVSTLTMMYLAVCAFYTVFKMRVWNFYYLAGGRQTDEYSLVFSGMLLSRLTPPLCLNAISLFHMDSHVIKSRRLETSYTNVMGHMDVLSLISDGFNIYFPGLILIVSLASWLGARIGRVVGVEYWVEEEDGDVAEMVTEGKELAAREKRRRLRNSTVRESRPRATEESGIREHSVVAPPRDLFGDV